MARERIDSIVGMRLHLDTDFAGDPDDACALAMLLGWPDVELVGITTKADPDGRRAGYVAHCLSLVDREDIPLAAGAAASITTGDPMGSLPDHDAYWPSPVPARPSPEGTALDLLDRSIALGAVIVAIGPSTNLALLEAEHPGRLGSAPVVAMGGWVVPPPAGFPAWGPERDWNVQCDTLAAMAVATTADLTLVPLAVTAQAHLRRAHLGRLAASGPLGGVLARQAAAHGAEHDMGTLGRSHVGLPDDLLNFHHDPLACAVAMGWPGAAVEELILRPVLDGKVLRFVPDHGAGRRSRVVTGIDGDGFVERWLTAVEAAQRPR
ncbi:hypothetical protein BH24ACT3_BH24ACT3_10690 [soil metagenome]